MTPEVTSLQAPPTNRLSPWRQDADITRTCRKGAKPYGDRRSVRHVPTAHLVSQKASVRLVRHLLCEAAFLRRVGRGRGFGRSHCSGRERSGRKSLETESSVSRDGRRHTDGECVSERVTCGGTLAGAGVMGYCAVGGGTGAGAAGATGYGGATGCGGGGTGAG